MRTILVPCRVPWSVAPTSSGVTLTHTETETKPECRVVLGGGRLGADGRMDDRWIEVVFESCYHARVGPKPDTEGIEAIGYEVREPYRGDWTGYLDWLRGEWLATGICPDPGFYIAEESAWLAGLTDWARTGHRHYVISGRDGYVEVIARRFAWREWLWADSEREDAPIRGPVVGEGSGGE